MRDCENGTMRDLLPEYLHGTLSTVARAEVESHLASCEVCGSELDLLRALHRTVSRAPAVDVRRIAEGVRRATVNAAPSSVRRREPAGHASRSRRFAAWPWAAAAAVILAAGAVAYVSRSASHLPATSPVAVRPDSAAHAPAPANAPIAPPRAVAPPTDFAQRGESSHVQYRAPAVAPSHIAAPPGANDELLAGLGDLSDAEARALLDRLDQVQALPDADPTPVLDGVGIDLTDAGTS